MNIISKVGQRDNVVTYEHICDTSADMSKIDRKYITLGSTCIVLAGESGAMEVYMADSEKEWHDILAGASSGSNTPSGLSIHICTQNEVSNGMPDIEFPLETELYLVPAREDSGNLYDEYVYVDGEWELFGGAPVNLNGYATQEWVSQQGYLTSFTETDPTVPQWAKAVSKPTYTAAEVGAPTTAQMNTAIATAIGDIHSFDVQVVQALPAQDIETHTIYFVPKTGATNDVYDEYLYINNQWEMIGNTQIDLTGYALTSAIPTKVSDLTNDSGFINPASQPTEDGTALVYVNGAWKAQEGYGYGGLTKSSLFNFTATDFIEDNSGYSATINLQEIAQSSTEEELEALQLKLISIFYNREEFEVKINDTIYNSVQDRFGYEASEIPSDPPIYDINFQNIFALRMEEQGITFYVYDVKPTSAEIIALFKNYTKISEDLLPTIPVKVGEGLHSTIEGYQTSASEPFSHAEGISTSASGYASHAEGSGTIASGETSHAEGSDTKALGKYSHTEGLLTHAFDTTSHAEGRGLYYEEATLSSTAEETKYQCSDISLFVMPMIVKVGSSETCITDIDTSNNTITVYRSLGNLNETPVKLYSGVAYGEQSHSEGGYTLAYGESSHAEGSYTFARSDYSHAEGSNTCAYGANSHAEGNSTVADGFNAHAEGYLTQANGNHSHAEGSNTKASGQQSHAEGLWTIAKGISSHAEGKYNIEDLNETYAHIVGNGTSSARSNAHTLDWNGNAWYAGKVTAGTVASPANPTAANDLTTKQYVDNALAAKVVSVEGTTPAITAVADTQYICGEVATLSFTPAAAGVCDIIFESGAIATVLTVPNTVKFPEWFDASALEANMTYEINITNGIYGAVMAWATA